MKITIKKGDLFSVDKKYYLAHCISSCLSMGAGIAVPFQKKFKLRKQLELKSTGKHPECIQVGRVFNLITKAKYWHKPTYQSVKMALYDMKNQIVANDIQWLAMPRISSGLDRLSWPRVLEMIKEVFEDVDIDIQVRYL